MLHSLIYNAAQHPVHSVTIFQVNRADVNRRVEVDLKKGQNEVQIKNLPNVLDPDSLRVDGIGKAVIFDVVYKPPPLLASGIIEESPEVKKLSAVKAELESELETANKESSILEQYSASLTSQHASAAQLADFLKIYTTRQKELFTKRVFLADQMEKINHEIDTAKKSATQDEESQKRMVQVVVIVLAEEDGPAELSISYGVQSASWNPLYDLRANLGVAETKDSRNSTVTLHYRASISQYTGEDWSNVYLTLSTATPQIASSIPTLRAKQVREDNDLEFRPKGRSSGIFPSASASFGQVAAAPSSYAAPPPTLFGNTVARPVSQGQGFSSTFAVEGLSNIPSNTTSTNEEHKVTIAVIDLSNVELEWVTVPKEAPSVFLRCKVKNTSQFTFLSGEASIFMNNNFVCKSRIPNVSPLESFACSLGVDSSLRVTYHPQSKKVNVPSGGLLTTRTLSTTFSQRITIKNTRVIAVDRLVVKDQVPMSNDARFKVAVLEPNLPEPLANSVVKEVLIGGDKTKLMKARWAPASEDADIVGEINSQGFMEWIAKIEGGTSLDLTLTWEVTVPKGLKWKII